jgi:hypothetical protein
MNFQREMRLFFGSEEVFTIQTFSCPFITSRFNGENRMTQIQTHMKITIFITFLAPNRFCLTKQNSNIIYVFFNTFAAKNTFDNDKIHRRKTCLNQDFFQQHSFA